MKHILIAAKSEFLILKRYPLNLFYTIIATLFFLLPLFYITKTYNVEQQQYLWMLSGGVFWMYISQALWVIGLSLRKEQEIGTLEQIFLSPTNLIFIMIGKSLITLGINSLTLSIGVLLIKYIFNCHINFLIIFIIPIISIPAIFGFAYIISGMVIKFKEIFAFLQVLVGLLFIFSGISQPIKFLPYKLGGISKFIVFEKMIYIFRQAIIDSPTFSEISNDLIYIGVYGLILNIIAIFIFYYFRKRVLKNGDGLYV
ncbi:hypothetical protein OSSY52_19460 [Tepiditoga spiralis]|uniref:ABC-2 type transporter transmembrane domain-containing protein n=1 Tax=Tepiditoga spiralis TaxID=2108365 RepID=A0A7G1G6K7_9BACT|nr:ABC transporter permease [Tepiditoga spiralis]BBE31805.1 hypothetical protein OSSY52_19460 [Tepiditoga spiralis]